jgi:RNA polymerase sigma-70 factor (ECF subfamily)
METPASLLERLRQPAQEQAWARFVDLYTPLLYTWARRTGCQESDAADLVQEVLSLLVRKLPEFTYDRRQRFRGWLHTVAHNCWRSLRRRAELPREAGAQDLDALPATGAADPFWEEEYRQRLVARALELMQVDFAPATWKACWECVVQGRPAAEVARDLGVRVGAVYTAKSRVLSRLRQELAGLLD